MGSRQGGAVGEPPRQRVCWEDVSACMRLVQQPRVDRSFSFTLAPGPPLRRQHRRACRRPERRLLPAAGAREDRAAVPGSAYARTGQTVVRKTLTLLQP